MRKGFLLILFFIIMLAVVGCGKKEDSIGIRGEIIEIYESMEEGSVLTFLVEGEIEEDTSYDKASVTVDSDAKVYIGDEEGSYKDLKEGVKIEVVFNGEVAESYPVQGTAKKIVILED
ncbi:YobA family protein [Tissierella sp. MSJ-40]|uniref:YobA family protein n=1 Tax=Tissierella simiarum TaxID=2841534 RepID=A0ABS6E392_9FIRM|nr:DUF3221 domain-containing protein [Tissierella simiarum]MBU5437368.1 YobA family protein [Tissierella simiarum]